MKHGPIALIDEKMPTMTVIPKDNVYEKMLSNISEIKSRVGYILAVAFEEDEEILERVDRVIPVPSANPFFYSVFNHSSPSTFCLLHRCQKGSRCRPAKKSGKECHSRIKKVSCPLSSLIK